MKVADRQLPNVMLAGLVRMMEVHKGQRLDRRSLTAGYYAAAAIFASAMEKDKEMVALFVEASTDAIERNT